MENKYVFQKLCKEDGQKKLACNLGQRFTVGVNVFKPTGQTYVHVGFKGRSLSLLLDDYIQLSNMRDTLEMELPWLYGNSKQDPSQSPTPPYDHPRMYTGAAEAQVSRRRPIEGINQTSRQQQQPAARSKVEQDPWEYNPVL